MIANRTSVGTNFRTSGIIYIAYAFLSLVWSIIFRCLVTHNSSNISSTQYIILTSIEFISLVILILALIFLIRGMQVLTRNQEESIQKKSKVSIALLLTYIVLRITPYLMIIVDSLISPIFFESIYSIYFFIHIAVVPLLLVFGLLFFYLVIKELKESEGLPLIIWPILIYVCYNFVIKVFYIYYSYLMYFNLETMQTPYGLALQIVMFILRLISFIVELVFGAALIINAERFDLQIMKPAPKYKEMQRQVAKVKYCNKCGKS
ncbi:MAG: hypothetical protein ACTSPI_15095, partial [Candidatus Heimdallarchaeaceae archaeon]